MTQKSVKGRAITDYLAHCSPEEAKEIQGDFPEEDIIGIKLSRGICILMEQIIRIEVALEFS